MAPPPRNKSAKALKGFTMKLGIFDSGLGGLVIARAVRDFIPDIDILYYGDTLHLPYGNRSEDAIFHYTRDAMDHMFRRNCQLIIVACNTASASALRRLQQTWLKDAWPGRNILGVVVPTLETAIDRGYKNLGLIATNYTIKSGVFELELKKINPAIRMVQNSTPLLVPLIENNGMKWIDGVLRDYLLPMTGQGMDCLILGCTHYPFIKPQIRAIIGPDIDILSQDEIIPQKLKDYLKRHPEHDSKITRSGKSEFEVSDITDGYIVAAREIYSGDVGIKKI